jgi:hypothetical protein
VHNLVNPVSSHEDQSVADHSHTVGVSDQSMLELEAQRELLIRHLNAFPYPSSDSRRHNVMMELSERVTKIAMTSRIAFVKHATIMEKLAEGALLSEAFDANAFISEVASIEVTRSSSSSDAILRSPATGNLLPPLREPPTALQKRKASKDLENRSAINRGKRVKVPITSERLRKACSACVKMGIPRHQAIGHRRNSSKCPHFQDPAAISAELPVVAHKVSENARMNSFSSAPAAASMRSHQQVQDSSSDTEEDRGDLTLNERLRASVESGTCSYCAKQASQHMCQDQTCAHFVHNMCAQASGLPEEVYFCRRHRNQYTGG